MSYTEPLAIRVALSTKERIDKLACYRPDGITVTQSQVVRAALEIGLLQLEKVAKESRHGR